MEKNKKNMYFIVDNYFNYGKIIGFLRIKNTLEAILFLVLVFFFLKYLTPFLSIKTKLIISLSFFVPFALVMLNGIQGYSFSEFVLSFLSYKRKSKRLRYRMPGEEKYAPKKKK